MTTETDEILGHFPCDPERPLRTPAELCAPCRLQYYAGTPLEDIVPGKVPDPVMPADDDTPEEPDDDMAPV